MRHGENLPARIQPSCSSGCPFEIGADQADLVVDSASGEDIEKALVMFEHLAAAMSSANRAHGPRDNNWIPAGYTYLGQLLAHDMTFHASPLPKVDRGQLQDANLRTLALDLDCLYGGGPELSPALYQTYSRSTEDGERRPRRKLRVGLTQNVCDGTTIDENDLPRVSVNSCEANLQDARIRREYHNNDPRSLLHESLIADSRNEDNLILSQLVVLFHKLHNKFVNLIESNDFNVFDPAVFQIARKLTMLCYQRVIVYDFLFRLIDPDIYSEYFDTPEDGNLFPLSKVNEEQGSLTPEFAIAALRIGHVMVRDQYNFNNHSSNPKIRNPNISTLLNFISENHTDSIPIPITSEWKIDWDLFFPNVQHSGPDLGQPIGGVSYNESRLIGPYIDEELLHHSRLQPASLHEKSRKSGPHYEHGRGGLIYRDLVRGFVNHLPSGQAASRNLFGKVTLTCEELKSGLLRGDVGANIKPFISRLTGDTPLFYYLLRESELKSLGRRIGPLGSKILSIVISQALESSDRYLDRSIEPWVHAMFPGGVPPRWMPDLVNFVENPSSQEPA